MIKIFFFKRALHKFVLSITIPIGGVAVPRQGEIIVYENKSYKVVYLAYNLDNGDISVYAR